MPSRLLIRLSARPQKPFNQLIRSCTCSPTHMRARHLPIHQPARLLNRLTTHRITRSDRQHTHLYTRLVAR